MKTWLIITLMLVIAGYIAFLGGMYVKTQLVLNDCMAQCDALIANLSGARQGPYQPVINFSEIIINSSGEVIYNDKYRESTNTS